MKIKKTGKQGRLQNTLTLEVNIGRLQNKLTLEVNIGRHPLM